MATNQNILPPPPIREKIYTNQGAMSQVWVNWFNLLFNRAGGGFSPSQSDLDVLIAFSDISAAATLSKVQNLEAEVADLQTEVLALQQQQADTDTFLAFQKDVDLT